MVDLINDHSRKLENIISKIERNTKLSQKNKKLILQFKDELISEGISKGRVVKYLYSLINISKLLGKDFDKTKLEDLKRLVGRIESSDYTAWTRHDYKVVIKRFWRWLRKSETEPEETRWIRTTIKRNETKLPDSLLNLGDIEKLVNATNCLRDKAMILCLYESGCRVGEFLPLKIRQVEFDEYGSIIQVNGKTGSRKLRLIASAPALANWLSVHPEKENPDAWVWCNLAPNQKRTMLTYQNFVKLIKNLGKKAGIKKPLNPHHFRHSRATELAKLLTEAQLCQYFGWVIGSKEASTYVHLSQRDMDKAILKIHGIEKEEERETEFKVKQCPRCRQKLSLGSKFCNFCGLALSIKEALEAEKERKETDKWMDMLIELPEVRRFLAKKLKEIVKVKAQSL